MAKVIMIQGTMSNAGKSFLAAGLCRIFKQDGLRTAPFKSQNMALNSYITRDGLEMGRAQVMQAEAAGIDVHCFIADEDVKEAAKASGMTRSAVSAEKAARLYSKCIYAVGNAPTALMRLYELIEEKKIRPALIIGVPVGFVNVVEAKELILRTDVPAIIARGRKGGSNIAAAICNALLYEAGGR